MKRAVYEKINLEGAVGRSIFWPQSFHEIGRGIDACQRGPNERGDGRLATAVAHLDESRRGDIVRSMVRSRRLPRMLRHRHFECP